MDNSSADVLLALAPHKRIGQAEGEDGYAFGRISGVAQSANGDIYVADAMAAEVLRYSPEGVFIGRFGGRGEGPGELRSIDRLVVGGDRVWIGEWIAPAAISEFTLDGAFVDRWSPRTPAGDELLLAAADSAGLIMTATRRMQTATRALQQQVFDLYRVTGRDAASLLFSVNGPRLGMTRWSGGTRVDWPLFDALPAWTAQPQAILVTAGSSYEIRIHGSDGTLREIVRRTTRPRRVAKRDIERWVQGEADRWNPRDFPPGSDTRETLLERATARASLPTPEFYPTLGELVPIAGGGFWVQRTDQVEDPTVFDLVTSDGQGRVPSTVPWDRFDSNGHYSGTAAFPANFKPSAATPSRVIGIGWDSNDVQSVLLLAVLSADNRREGARE